MANTAAVPDSFKRELLCGSHAFGTQAANSVRTVTTKDVFKLGLFLATATLNASTTAYSTTGEVTGTGYTAGGVTLTNANLPAVAANVAYWTPSANASWTTFTSSGAFDCALLYNSSSTGVLACGVFTFGSQNIVAGNFDLTMPTNNQTTGLIRIA